MKVIHLFAPPRWAWVAVGLLGLLGAARSSHAQNTNTTTAYNTGSAYHAGTFTNASGATFTNTGAGTVYYAGPAAATFTNNGTYAGAASSSDQFIGPGGAAGLQELAGTTAPTFYNLTLANGTSSAFTLSNPAGATVANLITFSNGITTTVDAVAGAIRLTSTGTQAATLAGTFSTTSYVDGYVAKAGTNPFTYPLGDTNPSTNTGNTTPANANIYSPITLSNPGGTTLRYTAGTTPQYTVFATQTPGLQLVTVSAREYYPVSVGTVPGTTTITIPYSNFGRAASGTPYVGDPTTLTIAGYNGTNWTNLSATPTNTINTSAKTVTVTLPVALSATYSALTLASTSAANPLPVTLVTFAAVAQGEDGLLTWQTASELNSSYFEPQGSADGHTWQPLAKVAAAGTSLTSHAYRYLDRNIARYHSSQVYYRLRQVDLDAKESFSPTVVLSWEVAWRVTPYPNPFATDLTAQLTTTEAGPVQITLLSATGQVVLRRELAGTPGTQLIALGEASALATGTYTLLVRQNAHTAAVHVLHQ